MTVTEILARLVAFPSVAGRPNGDIVEWIAGFARAQGAAVSVLNGPEGDRANLFATIGPRDVPGLLLSGHMDVVPADEAGWRSDPFTPRRDAGRVYGRGASDMKGFLAAALACLPEIRDAALRRPLHLAFSYDEEIGCRGAPHLIAALPSLCAPPELCVIGEPSGLRPVRAHKGKAAARLTLTGRAGHSSRPELGLNAIHAMSGVLARAVQVAETLADGPRDDIFAPPCSTLQLGVVRGGTAVNVIPDSCAVELEARAIPGVAPRALLEPVRDTALTLRAQGYGVEWKELSAYPALSGRDTEPMAAMLSGLTGRPALQAVSYGTEAGLFEAAGLQAVICGPGDIARAHKPDEYIRDDELSEAVAMIRALIATLRI